MITKIGDLARVIAFSWALLTSWCITSEKEVFRNRVENILEQWHIDITNVTEEDNLTLEQLPLDDIINSLNELLNTVTSERSRVDYNIIRLKTLGVENYNKAKIKKWEKNKKCSL